MKCRKIIVSLLAVAVLGACSKISDKFDSNLNNPNTPSPESANSDLYLNVVQLSFAGLFNGISDIGMQVTRQIVMYGPTYSNAYQPQSFDGLWDNAYTSVLKHANVLIPIAEAQKKYVVVGMTKIMKAYTLMAMVDMFGNIPYTDANQGAANTNPTLEQGKDVYAKAIALLDDAIADLAKTPASYPGVFDLYYKAGNAAGAAKWATLAKTLKLRAYMTTRLVDASAKSKIDALLTANDLIDTPAEDFEFKYGTLQTNPNSRHPRYNGNYSATGSAGDYLGTYFMWTMVREKGSFSNNTASDKSDPRTRYYFYRQRANYADVSEVSSSCSVAPPPAHYPAGMPFCLITSGFWGRDHGDNSGIPPDGPLRTTVGIYPCGGDFDTGQGTSVSLNRGGQGAGIQPIWQSAFTEFLKAEANLILSTAGNARTSLQNGITASFAKVLGYPATVGITPNPTYVPSAARQTQYITDVLTAYDAATTNDAKLDIIMKEYYIALWGNGIDAYNNYRRTGKPSNMQLPIVAAPGAFVSSMYYPSVHVNRNQNGAQKSGVDVHVFWDTNPPGFNK